MRLKNIAVLGTTIALSSFGAAAAELPRYDPPRYCETVSDVSGGSRMIYNGCIQMEQEAYDALKSTWSTLSNRTKTYCDEVARSSDSSYSILKGCIDMESDASSSTPGFKF